MFNGFPLQLFDFMNGLYHNNSKIWFNENCDIYEKIVKPTVRDLVSALAPFIKILNQNLETSPKFNKTIGRLHNDTRFHKNKPPHKNYIFISFPKEGRRWSDAPFLYLAIHRSGIYVGFWSGDGKQFNPADWQKRLLKNSTSFKNFLRKNHILQSYFTFGDSKEDGPGKLKAIQPDFDYWLKLANVSIGNFYPREDKLLFGKEVIKTTVYNLFDLYPLYIFQTSPAIEADLMEYFEKKENFKFF